MFQMLLILYKLMSLHQKAENIFIINAKCYILKTYCLPIYCKCLTCRTGMGHILYFTFKKTKSDLFGSNSLTHVSAVVKDL